MLKQFRPFGITQADFLGRTPLMKNRGEEILTFLSRHPNITDFVAVDDEEFACDLFPADRFVLTELARGITEPVKNLIIEKLLEPKK